MGLLLAACGGGGSSTSGPVVDPNPPVLAGDLATDYEPSGTGSATFRYDSGATGTYSWTPGRIRWGDSVEHHRVRTCSGEDWYWLDGYSPAPWLSGEAPIWPVETLRAEWINVDAGTTEDISRLCKTLPIEANGQPYLPNDLPRSGHFRVRVWGWLWASGKRDRRWYWQADLTFGLVIVNPCWQGTQANRRAFEMREIWWDDNGFVRGTLPVLPWSGNTPVDPGPPTYTWTATYGKDAGPLWTFKDLSTGQGGCLVSVIHQ
jgi:hypothetical protein